VNTPATTKSEKRYRNFLGVIASDLPPAGILLSVGLAAVYLAVPAWQLLASAGVALFATMGSGLAYILFHRGKANTSLITLVFFLVFLLIGHDLLFASQPVFFIAGVWLIPIFLVWNATPSIRLKIITPIISILATAVIVWIEIRQPVPRVNVSDLALLRWLIPLTSVILGAMLIIVVTRAMDTRRLYRRLLYSFLLIVLIPVVTISATTSISSIQTDRRYAVSTLENITAQKEDALTLWLDEMQYDLRAIPLDTTTGNNILTVLDNIAAGQDPGPERAPIIAHFKQAIIQTARLEEIFLLDPNGIVVAASNSTRTNRNYRDQEFFIQGKAALFIAPPVYFKDADEISIFISQPIINSRAQMVGVLVGRANMRTPSQIMATRAGLGTSGKIYLLSGNYDVLNGVVNGKPTETIRTNAAVEAVTKLTSGSLFYNDSQNIPVVGVYRWIPALNVAIVAEMNQSEAFGSVSYVLTTNIIIAIVSAALTLMGALLTIQTINRPVSALVDTAREVAAGNFSARAQIEQEDELGVLAQTMNDTTAQMQEMVANLEQRVSERTRDLERRTREVQSAAQIARDASTARNLDDLLNRSAHLISERFGFYHVGIFLLDERGEYALLSAAAGDAGKLMLANKHKLKVGEVGIVGYVTQTGESRVALDTGEDAIYFRNPFLPYTHSEMALPLKIGARVIGALDVQSEKVNAFDQQDAETMRILADQIAVAIERTRLLEQLEGAVARMETSSQEYSGRAWREFMQHTRASLGFRYRGVKAELITEPPAEGLDAQVKGTTIVQNNVEKGVSILSVPIKLRGLPLGALNVRFQGEEIPPQTIAVIEEAANRLALALENARLIQDTRRLAAREKQVNIITTQIQRATDIETVLQNAIRELGNTIGVPKTFIQIGFNKADDDSKNEAKKHGEA
jgi:GAF domain-containing protein/HAMP domain-containing protein